MNGWTEGSAWKDCVTGEAEQPGARCSGWAGQPGVVLLTQAKACHGDPSGNSSNSSKVLRCVSCGRGVGLLCLHFQHFLPWGPSPCC
jgi:hypothetical protein